MKLSEKIRLKALQFLNLDNLVDDTVQLRMKDIKKTMLKDTKVFQHSGSLVTIVGAEYPIFQVDQPCKFWGFVDVDDFRVGDKVEIKILYKSPDGKYKHHFYKELVAPFPNPIYSFDERVANGVEVRIRQTSGFPERTLVYNWGWTNL